jgi:F-type H+-transporting ATPase subunit epsilon
MDAMSDHILLEVVTPDRRVLSTQVSELQFRTATRGYYGILPGHTPTLTPLGDGLLYYTQSGEKRWITVFGGFAEVGPEHVTVLARVAETPDMLDPEKAQGERAQAEMRL